MEIKSGSRPLVRPRFGRDRVPTIACLFAAAVVQIGSLSAAETHLYVAPAGNDAWSGSLPAANSAASDGPFASVRRARDRVREIRAEGPVPVTVHLFGGVYRQEETLVFTPADSGSAESPVTYQAEPGELPIISGGGVLRSWKVDASEQLPPALRGKVWSAPVPALTQGTPWHFNQLFVGEQRRVRARHPNKGAFLRSDGPHSRHPTRGFFFKEGDVKSWDRLSDALFIVCHSWETSIHHVRSLDPETRQVTFLEHAPWPMGHWERQQRYSVENIFEALDEPGEWYLNADTATVFYLPLPGEKVESFSATAPILTSTLVRFEGDPAQGRWIEHLRFRGLGFHHSDAALGHLRNSPQAEINQPALIQASGLRHTVFEGCEIAHTGAHGIWLGLGCEDNLVRQCHLHDLGGGGVYLGGGWGLYEDPPAARNTVDNCFVHDGGHLFHGAHGVWIGKSSHNRVTHNEISNFDYSGISCGWSWGFQPSSAHHNQLDYNHIHHLGNGSGLSDMGGIYTLGISPGTTVRGNHIHHIYSYAPVSHGSGIYPDEGSSQILIENNVVHHVETCALFQHYGKDNLVRNNILAFGGKGQMQRCREDKPCHFIAEGNLVYSGIADIVAGVWKNGDWKLGRNLYWSTAGEPKFLGMNFAEWQKKTGDEGSLVADPLFVDPEKGDFRLREGSPALKSGFRPIDFSQIGLYGERKWTDLPKRYPNRPLTSIPPAVEPPFRVLFDFESDEPGEAPLAGHVLTNRDEALLVSEDTAAAGSRRSLKFVDAPTETRPFCPHLYYEPHHAEGDLRLTWDLLNTAEAPADLTIEVRQWDREPYLVGPSLAMAANGAVTAGDQSLGTLPLGKWVRVEIAFSLGAGAAKTYEITLRVPGRDPVVARVPFRSPEFERVTWLGVMSNSKTDAVFYLDNVRLGTSRDPEHPPQGTPHRPRPEAHELANDDHLLGHWTFDEDEGFLSLDRSGNENDGEIGCRRAVGDFGGAVFCDPAASSVRVPDNATVRFGRSDFSIELWLYPTQLSIDSKDARRRFMSKDHYPHTWWNLNLTAAGTPYLEMVDDRRVTCAIRPVGTLPENAWSHFAVVVDRTRRQVRYFLNGKPDHTGEIPADFIGSLDAKGGDLFIGNRWQPFLGMLDEVRLYRRTLRDDEILARYESEKGRHARREYRIAE